MKSAKYSGGMLIALTLAGFTAPSGIADDSYHFELGFREDLWAYMAFPTAPSADRVAFTVEVCNPADGAVGCNNIASWTITGNPGTCTAAHIFDCQTLPNIGDVTIHIRPPGVDAHHPGFFRVTVDFRTAVNSISVGHFTYIIRQAPSHFETHSWIVGQDFPINIENTYSDAVDPSALLGFYGLFRTNVTLARNNDLNSDGDFEDANERNVLWAFETPGTGTCNLFGAPHFSCSPYGSKTEYLFLVWRGTSSFQQVGNYTLNITDTSDQSPGVHSRWNYAIRLIPSPVSIGLEDGQTTRALINQSYANVTQNITHVDSEIHLVHQNLTVNFPYTWNLINESFPGPGPGPGNETINHTTMLSLFTQDCHGTELDLCINGHELNTVNDSTLRFLALVLIMGLAAIAAIQGGTLYPTIGFVLAFAEMLFVLINFELIGIPSIVFVLAPLVVMYYAGTNLASEVRRSQSPGKG